MPRTLVRSTEVIKGNASQESNQRTKYCPCSASCCSNAGEKFDWDAFTLSVGLIFLFLGCVCCTLQIASILSKFSLECYGVGLWCSAGFLVSAVLATLLYKQDRVAPVAWMIASVVCDLALGVILPMIGVCLASQCVRNVPIFIGIALACFFGILTAAYHAALFVREVMKLRYQLRRKPSLSEGLSRALKVDYRRGS